MRKRLKTRAGKLTYQLRMHTVEPVFGSLQQYYELRRIYVRGKNIAYKVMLMAASAFNLKKWLKQVVKETIDVIFTTQTVMTYLMSRNIYFSNFSPVSIHSEYQYIRTV